MADIGALCELVDEFGLNITLKPEQTSIIDAICRRKDVLGVLPTGFGKSMSYILVPLLMDKLHEGKLHTAVVVSPLKALMADQVHFLREHGISAAAITEDTTVKGLKDMGHISVLFCSPESAVLKKWQQFFRTEVKDRVCVLVFDEAHCISSWGHDFRPSYRQVPVIQSFLDAPNLLLTATATQQIQQDLYDLLGLEKTSTEVVSALPNRPNIFLDIRPSTENFENELAWLLQSLQSSVQRKKILVYVQSISKCSQIYMWLTTNLLDKCFEGQPSVESRRVEMYHSNTDEESKTRIVDQFLKEDSKMEVLISTVAFGMGVNVPNIDVVVHWGAPQNALRYWQEVGRCARDGRRGYALCYAYKRSATKCEHVKFKSLLSNSDCVRHTVLENFLLEGMNKADLDSIKAQEDCDGSCTACCTCNKCRCCIRCQKTCQCRYAREPFENFLM